MDNLWAPWRMEYINDARMKEGGAPCVFCEVIKTKPDANNLVLTKQQRSYVVMNRFPYNAGHLMVIPNAHQAKLTDLDEPTRLEVMNWTARCMTILKEAMQAQGFNCGFNAERVAGCGITEHFHMHIVPRWQGDTNFLPVLGKSKQMSEYLAETYNRLAKYF